MKVKTKKKLSFLGILLMAVLSLTLVFTSTGIFNVSAGEHNKFYTDFASFADEQAAAAEFNVKLAEESMALLKNKNNVLPLGVEERNITLLGTRSDNHILGGSGSGSGSAAGAINIPTSLKAAGFSLNPLIESYYASTGATAEPKVDVLAPFVGSFNMYGDAAVIVISRTGSEFNEANLWGVSGHSDMLDQNYSLDDNEKELIKFAKEHFDKVILVVNSAHPVELGLVKDEGELECDAIVWMGHPGTTGATALGRILNGSVNPSGHLVDVYGKDFKTDPTWQNFCNSVQGHLVSGFKLKKNSETDQWEYDLDEKGARQQELYIDNYYDPDQLNANDTLENIVAPAWNATAENNLKYNIIKNSEGEYVSFSGPSNGAQWVANLDYEEGIYMGYRWYETAYAEIKAGRYQPEGLVGADDDEKAENWYNSQVAFPFGCGLSYTEFDWQIMNKDDLAALDASDNAVTVIKAKVTNNGSVAGKDVAQIYFTAPYTVGGIEKPAVSLVKYAKSKLLAPGESQIIDISFKTQDMASFDYYDANENSFQGYELEAGDYILGIYDDAHTAQDTVTASLALGRQYTTDAETGAPIENLFYGNGEWDGTRSDADYYATERQAWMSASGTDKVTRFTRADFAGTFPKAPTEGDLTYSDDAIKVVGNQIYYTSFNDLPTDPWYHAASEFTGEGPYSGWTQCSDTSTREGGKCATLLKDMNGVPYDDPAWDAFMNQLTYAEMVTLVSSGRFSTGAVNAIGKPQTTEADGPAQLSGGTFWCCCVNIASTWNVDLAYKQGLFVGNESLYLGKGWYGPGLNTHRNPAAGRNFEYYSQDGIQGGYIAAAVIKGATEKGMTVWMKHLFLNDEETNRYNAATFCNEQAIREIYIKPFEMSIKFGGGNASMSAFNRVGLVSTTANYNLYQKLLQKQFGFRAATVTDMFGWSYSPGSTGDMAARVSIIPLGSWTNTPGRNIEGTWDAEKNTVVCTFNPYITNGTVWNGTEADLFDGDGAPLGEGTTNYGLFNTATGGSTSRGFGNAARGHLQLVNYGNSKSFKDATTLKNGTAEQAYAEGDTIDSYTQWFAVRKCAKDILFVQANSNNEKNGYDMSSAFSAQTVTLVRGINKSVPLAKGDIDGLISFSKTNADDSLPAGVNLSSAGVLSGAPTTTGNTRISITMAVDDWVKQSANVTINVIDPLTLSVASGNVNEEFNSVVTFNAYKVGDLYNGQYAITGINSLSIRSGGPAGLSLGAISVDPDTGIATASLTGTPTATGTFNISIRAVVAYYQNRARTANVDATVALTITDPSAVPVVDHGGITGIEKTGTEGLVDTYTITYADGATETFTVTNGADGAQGPAGETGIQGPAGETGAQGPAGPTGATGAKGDKGDKGDKGEKGDTGAAGADGKDACSGSVTGTLSIVMSLIGLAALAVIIKRRAR